MPVIQKKESHMGDGTKKIFLTLLGILLVYLIVWVGALMRNTLQEYYYIGQADRMERTITVDGTGKVQIVPDVATLSFGMTSDGKSVDEAQTKNTSVMNGLIEKLKALSIDAKDIQTSQYSVSPVYDYANNTQTLKGYQVSQQVTVRIRDVAKSDKVVALAGETGANMLGGIQFTIDDPQTYQEQAREKAIADAFAKAKKLSSTLGVHLVRVVSYNEFSGGTPGPIMYAKSMDSMATREGAPAPSIEPGSNDVMTNVSITYEIR